MFFFLDISYIGACEEEGRLHLKAWRHWRGALFIMVHRKKHRKSARIPAGPAPLKPRKSASEIAGSLSGTCPARSMPSGSATVRSTSLIGSPTCSLSVGAIECHCWLPSCCTATSTRRAGDSARMGHENFHLEQPAEKLLVLLTLPRRRDLTLL